MHRKAFLQVLTFPEKDLILAFLRKFSQRKDLYIVGGAIRDFLLGKPIYDLDLAIKEEPSVLAHFLAKSIHYTPIPLSEEFGIYRLAKGKYTIDLTLYRGRSIDEDLKERDFTLNALAVPLRCLFEEPFEIYDPLGGLQDLQKGIIRAIEEKNILSDPLRILRGYRFLAQGYGYLESKTRVYFQKYRDKILLVSPERINLELKYILLTDKSFLAFQSMVEDGVFEIIFPEFELCKGLPQPSFHHLDVFSHNLEALKMTEEILKNPKEFLPLEEITQEIQEEDFILTVKLASLFHDLGKGYTFEDGEERITFYGHEKIGTNLWMERAKRLRFKGEIIERVSRLIKHHMRPCHLLKEWERGKLSLRAKRNLIKDCPNLLELWIVTLADSLASKGVDKEADYEEKLNNFFKELFVFKGEMERVEKRERLLTGKDLINLGFIPGPYFKTILEEVELKTIEGILKTKEEALSYVLKNFEKLIGKPTYGNS